LELLKDEVGCILKLCEGVSSIEELKGTIRQLFDDSEGGGDSRDAVLLGTIHRCKGLERNSVFVLAPSLIPHPLAELDWERQQERNVAYIAGTRARFETGRHPGRLIFAGLIPSIYNNANCIGRRRP
jgi:hypothetical protein